jgi:rhamnosyl/mannosyltransferase
MPYYLRKLKPDLVHLHTPHPLGIYSYLLATPRTPLVITHHCDIVRQTYLKHLVLPFYHYVLRKATAIVLYTRYYGQTSPELEHVRDKFVIIPHGTQEALFEKTEHVARQARRIREKYTAEAPVVTFVGRTVHYKGLHILLRALVRLPRVHALIGGDGRDFEQVKRLARQLEVEEQAHFVGRLTDKEKAPYFCAGDVFVLPSVTRGESFGQVQVEAQLCRRPVVTTTVGGAAEVTVDGETGRVVPPEDPDALADALERLMENPSLRKRFGEAGYQRAKEHYVNNVTGPKLRRFFRQLEQETQ